MWPYGPENRVVRQREWLTGQLYGKQRQFWESNLGRNQDY